METYILFFVAASVPAYVLCLTILAFGKPSYDMYFMAAPVAIAVGALATLWLSTLSAYTANNSYDLLLALVLTTAGSAIMATARYERVAHPNQDRSLMAGRRRGVTISQLIFAVSALLWGIYWLAPKIRYLLT